jgi:hypothetical protein
MYIYNENGTYAMKLTNTGIATFAGSITAGSITAGGDITATGADFTLAHAAGATVYLRRDDTSISDGNVLGLINFQGDDPTDDTFNTGVALMGKAAGDWASGSYESEFILQTRNTSGGLVTALTVNEAQNATFIGTVSAPYITANNASGAANGTAQEVARFVNTTSGATSAYMYIGASSGTDWRLGKNIFGTASNSNFGITKHSGTVMALEIDNSLNTHLSGTLQVNGSNLGIGGAAANASYGSVGTKLDMKGGADSIIILRGAAGGSGADAYVASEYGLYAYNGEFMLTRTNQNSWWASPDFKLSGGNATFNGDVEIHKSGNDTTGKLTISGNNNTGTPGQKTSGTIEHRGEHLKTVITHAGSDVITIGTGTDTTFAGNVDVDGGTLNVGSSNEVSIVSSGSSHFPSLKINNNGYVGSASVTDALKFLTSGDLQAKTKIGIGIDPTTLLHIKGTGDAIRVESTNTGAGGAQIDLLHFTTSPADADTHASINMGGYYTGTTSVYGTSIKSVWKDVSARQAKLTFTTRNGGNFIEALSLTHEQHAVFSKQIIMESGTGGTTSKLILKTSDNSDESKWIRTNAYWVEHGGHANEGFKFIDTGSNILLQMNGGAQTGGNGALSATFPGSVIGAGGNIGMGKASSTPSISYGMFHYSGIGLGIYSGAGGGTQGIGFWLNNGTAAYEAGRWTQNGNFGIGDLAPTSISSNTASLSVGSSRTDLSGALINKANGTVKHQQYWDSSGYGFNLSASSGDFRWKVNNNERMTVNADGGLDIQGTVGQLFSVTNSLTGDLFSVSDISGVPIFNVNSSGAVDVDGTFTSSGTITSSADVVAYSDERLKTNIETLDGSKVYDMRGVSFIKDDKQSSGVIAQELEKIAPELVNNDCEYKAVAYGNITGYLIEAIKDLKKEIEQLKKQIK